MAFSLFQRLLENQDETVVAYRKYSQTEQDKYQTYSICFTGASFHWYHDVPIFDTFGLYSPEFEQVLMGKSVVRYEYNSSSGLFAKEPFTWKRGMKNNLSRFHLQPSDILVKAKFATENPLHARIYENGGDDRLTGCPPLYVGYQTPKMICFTRDFNEPANTIRLYDEFAFERSKLNLTRHRDTKIQIFFTIQISFLGRWKHQASRNPYSSTKMTRS